MSPLEIAIAKLKAGEVIALPTETVYGLAVDAANPKALAALYELKKRPSNKPFVLAIQDATQIADWAFTDNDDLERLTQHFWPGPLTLILKAKEQTSSLITAGLPSIAFRCSSAEGLQSILNQFGRALCLTSANLSGEAEACSAEAVRKQFKDNIYIYVHDQDISGQPSTILDLSTHPYCIRRQGFITQNAIETLLKIKIKNHAS